MLRCSGRSVVMSRPEVPVRGEASDVGIGSVRGEDVRVGVD
jgi:hypothetical protein